jgi:hypothetical protein
MADTDSSASPLFCNVADDSPFVHRAMYQLGFLCDFADLSTEQMRVTLAMAELLKRTQGQPETWES